MYGIIETGAPSTQKNVKNLSRKQVDNDTVYSSIDINLDNYRYKNKPETDCWKQLFAFKHCI